MKTYTGDRTIDGVKVLVDGRPLPDRSDINCFSQMGFEWGYEGAEPRQLAFALLIDHCGKSDFARSSCEQFMRSVIANFDNEWLVTSEDIEEYIAIIGVGT